MAWIGTGYAAQRFDANGALVGTPISVGNSSAKEFVADGSDLLALQVASQRVGVYRIDASGNASAENEVGGGEVIAAHVVRFGSELLVGWTRPGHLELATTTP